MFSWEPEGCYHCTKSMVITPFWFSMKHHWTALTPFWLSADNYPSYKNRIHHNSSKPVAIFVQCTYIYCDASQNKMSIKWNPGVPNYFVVKVGCYHGGVDKILGTQTRGSRFKSTHYRSCAIGETLCLHCLVCRIGLKAVHLMLA